MQKLKGDILKTKIPYVCQLKTKLVLCPLTMRKHMVTVTCSACRKELIAYRPALDEFQRAARKSRQTLSPMCDVCAGNSLRGAKAVMVLNHDDHVDDVLKHYKPGQTN